MRSFKAGEERTIEAGRKGGLRRSPNKTLQNRLKGYKTAKNKGLYFDEKIKPLIEDPDLMAGALITHLTEIKDAIDASGKLGLKMQLQKLLNDAFKTVHGERRIQHNVNYDVSAIVEQMEKRLKEYKEKEEVVVE